VDHQPPARHHVDGDDADVSGSSDSVLVTFAVRLGRLSKRTSLHCDFATAAPHPDATQASWIEFVRRNAESRAATCRVRWSYPDPAVSLWMLSVTPTQRRYKTPGGQADPSYFRCCMGVSHSGS
jgi:hypothetical protein